MAKTRAKATITALLLVQGSFVDPQHHRQLLANLPAGVRVVAVGENGKLPPALPVVLLLLEEGEDTAQHVQAVRARDGKVVVLASLGRAWGDVADFVAEPGQAGEAVARLLSDGAAVPDLRGRLEIYLDDVCDLLRKATGNDFRHYRKGFLLRRLERRLGYLRAESVDDYVERLRQDPEELQSLFEGLLIGVTHFFRDPEAFEALRGPLRQMLRQQPGLRMWSASCASGEEAYSLAILVLEVAEELGLPTTPELRILATDLDEEALEQARVGRYPLTIREHVSEERLARFFISEGEGYKVGREVRQLCQFCLHNLVSDPPFIDLDLVLCRNVLIYLGTPLQEKLIPLFHYALKPGGYLLLGTAESVGEKTALFSQVAEPLRLYRRVEGPAAVGWLPTRMRGPATPTPIASSIDFGKIVSTILQEEFTPRAALINEEGRLVWSSGELDHLLSLGRGSFHNQIVQLARKGLKTSLRSAILQARRTLRTAVRTGIRVKGRAGVGFSVDVTVQPMPALGTHSGLFLVVFQERPETASTAVSETTEESREVELERELARLGEELERTVQDLEATNEELKSSNEELWAMNEELRVANEELEKSRADAESKNQQLNNSNLDLAHLLTSTEIPTLFLDLEQRVLRFTPSAARLFYILPGDLGRPLGHLKDRATSMPPLPARPEEGGEDELQLDDGSWMVRKVLPYRDKDGSVVGMVLTFNDVTELRRSRIQLDESLSELRAIYDLAPVGQAVVASDHRLVKNNRQFLRLMGGGSDLPEPLARAVDEALHSGQLVEMELAWTSADGVRDCLARLLPNPDRDWVNLVVQDISWLKQRERAALGKAAALEVCHELVAVMDVDGELRYLNPAGRKLVGLPAEAPLRLRVADLQFPDDVEMFVEGVRREAILQGSWSGELRLRHLNTGQVLPVQMEVLRVDDPESGRVMALGLVASDLRPARRSAHLLEESRRQTGRLFARLGVGYAVLDQDGRFQDVNDVVLNRAQRTRPEMIGHRITDTIAGWGGSRFEQGYRRALKGEVNRVLDFFEPHGRWYQSTYCPAAEDDVAVIQEDYSERKSAEDRLRELASVVDNARDLVALCDSKLRVRFLNPAGSAMVGRNADLFPLEDLFTAGCREEVRCQLVAGAVWEGEAEMAGAFGEAIPVSVLFQPVHDPAGHPLGFSVVARGIGERQRRERELRESESRFRQAVVKAPIPVLILADDGEVLAISETLTELTGYLPGEVSRLAHWLLIAHRERADEMRERIARMMEEGGQGQFEAPVFTRTGERLYWRFTGTAAGQLDDGRRYAVLMASDLSDRLEKERLLTEGNDFLRRTLDSLSLFACVCTPEGVVIQTNSTALAAGAAPEDVVGRRIEDTYWMADLSATQSRVRHAVREAAAGRPARADVDLRMKDGRLVTMDFQVVPMRDRDGKVTHLVTSGLDVSERKAIEREMVKAKDRFRALLDSTFEAIYGVDLEGNCSFANPACLRLLGYESDRDVLGKNAHELFHHSHPDGRPYPAEECPLLACFETERPVYSPNEVFFRSDGRQLPVEAWAHPKYRNGRLEGCVITFLDSTKRLERDRELSRAKQAAEAANRAKSEFLANMSHEIRTPMAAILGYVDILLRQVMDSDNINALQIIQRNGRHLLEIINDVLDLSKIEAGSLEVEEIAVSVHAVVSEVVSLMEGQAIQKGLELKVSYSGPLPETISSDPTRLRQIVMNLLGNAIKFTERGSILLTVGLDAAERLVRFSLHDTGIGIKSSRMEALFQPFNQADTSVTRRFGGTGLGLAISAKLVQLLGGSIRVESQEGEGTTFTFTVATGSLENVSMIEPERLVNLNAAPPSSPPLPDLTGTRVLVVDDRRDIRFLVQTYLEEAGAHVSTAGDGQAALDFLEASRVDVMVLDMQMPTMDGYATARALRQRGDRLPILALTASAMKGDRELCVEAGCDGYLTKPVERSALVHQVSLMAQSRGPLKVLVVEDNPLAAVALKGMLVTLGCEAETAYSGAAALERATEMLPDLLLLDLGLPDMDGWDLLARLRELEGLEQARFVAHTGETPADVRKHPGSDGFHAILQKPANREALTRLLFG